METDAIELSSQALGELESFMGEQLSQCLLEVRNKKAFRVEIYHLKLVNICVINNVCLHFLLLIL